MAGAATGKFLEETWTKHVWVAYVRTLFMLSFLLKKEKEKRTFYKK